MKKRTMLALVVTFAAIAAALTTSCGSNNSTDLFSITISPGTMSIPQGSTIQYKATGNYNDDTTADLTTSVTWSSSNTLVSIVSNSTGSQGLATGIAAGTATITATEPTTGKSGSVTLTVL